MLVIIILSVSILLQLTTAFLAFRLIKVTGNTYSWIIISIAFCLMGFRRLITLAYSIVTPQKYSPNLNSEIVALIIALLMLIGVLLIRPLFLKRRKAEEAIERKAYEWEATFDATNSAIWILDCSQRVLRSNKTAERVFGTPVEDIIGKHCWEIVHGTEHPIEDCPTGRVVKSLRRETMELRVGDRWFEVAVDPILDSDGLYSGAVHIVSDITDRKQTEDDLRMSQQRFRSIVESSPMGMYLYEFTNDGRLVFQGANPAADRIIGVDHKMFIGKSIEEAFPGLIATEVPEQYRKTARNGGMWRTDMINYDDGRIAGAFEVWAFQTEPGRIAAMFNEVSERKQTEEELKKYREHLEELVKERTAELEKINLNLQAEINERIRVEEELASGRNMLRTLIDSMPEEIYAKDSESRYILANKQILSSFGFKEFHEIIGKTDFNFLSQNEAMENYRDENSVLKARGQIRNFEKPFTNSEGNIRWYGVTKVPMRDTDGRITGLVGIKRDITDHKEAEENLQEAKEAAEAANRAKSAFLSNMSHEIRTPLNAIMGFSELMLNDKNLTEEQNAWLNTINKSGEHLLAIINDILEISRIEAGQTTFNPSTFNLHDMLKDIETMFRVKTEARNLHFLAELADDLPKYIVADEAKLRQIFINIVGNAIKFTQEGGIVLRVRTKESENGKLKLMAEVEDTGPGIEEKDIDVLFQMFGQTETGIREGGTGLGLAISQQYAKIMEGGIAVKSEHGKGTCFTVTVEIALGEKPGKKDSARNRVVGLKQGESFRVLVVDDREINRNLLKEMLSPVGFEIAEAKDGLEAIKMFKSWLPDVILMDMRMPVMNGYEAIKSIKSMNSPEDKKVPIIAVTASAFSEDRTRALEAGADLYLRKPFKEQELFESIGSCLDVHYVYE